MYTLAPSVYAADYMHLREQLSIMNAEDVKYLHIDIMDGHFVPNLSFGPDFIHEIRFHTNMILDVHLMIMEPIRLIRQFSEAGADRITVHFEACRDLEATLDSIHQCGLLAGIALKPETQIGQLSLKLWAQADIIQLMSVAPGLKGQYFIPESIKKIRQAKHKIISLGRPVELEVDGDINPLNLESVIRAGADIVVIGKGLFQGNLRQNIQMYQKAMKAIEEGKYALLDRY